MSPQNYHDSVSNAETYCAHKNLTRTTRWDSLGRDRADILVHSNGKPASLTIVGTIVNDKLIAGPLGNFQYQDKKFSNYDSKMDCSRSKIVVVINTPSSSDYPIWAQDYEAVTKNLKDIQETAAKSKPNAPRQHFLDLKTGPVPSVRFTHALWEKKVSKHKIHQYCDSSYSTTVHP